VMQVAPKEAQMLYSLCTASHHKLRLKLLFRFFMIIRVGSKESPEAAWARSSDCQREA